MNNLIFKKQIKNIAIIFMIAIFFIADRGLKNIALSRISDTPINLIGDIFSFSFTPNYYMAFSLPLGGKILNTLIISIILLLVFLIIYLIINKKTPKYFIVILTIILFGAISNILDRFIYGYVIDYFYLKYFTVFNLADMMISGGALIIILKNLKK